MFFFGVALALVTSVEVAVATPLIDTVADESSATGPSVVRAPHVNSIDDSTLVKRVDFPYDGAFDGVDFDTSCGDELPFGSTDAPLVLDCYKALARWLSRNAFFDGNGPLRELEGTCLLTYHPDRESDVVWPAAFHDHFVFLMNGCVTGTSQEYVSNNAHISDATTKATFTISNSLDEAASNLEVDYDQQ